MTDAAMVDVAFAIAGSRLPREHRRALGEALIARLPWLAATPGAGVHPIKLAPGSEREAWLSKRSRLALRVPRAQAGALEVLAGARLEVADAPITLAALPAVRELLPHRTLYAQAVQENGSDEIGFLEAVQAELGALGVSCRPICGRARSLVHEGGAGVSFSLMLDGLSAADALRVMQAGIGANRVFGCGLFVPHRSAAAVGH